MPFYDFEPTGIQPIASGGTGGTTAAEARVNLGVAIGTDVAPINSPAFSGTVTLPALLIRTDTTTRVGQLHLSGDLGTTGASQFYFDGWNSTGNAAASPALIARSGRGTRENPLRTLINDQLFAVAARGSFASDNTAVATIESSGRAGIFVIAAENHTSTGQGTRLEIHTTPIGGATKATAAVFGADKSLIVNSTVTATSFTGSGAGLTAIPQTGVAGLTAAIAGKEPILGNPVVDGRVLSSSISGMRQWISLPSADHSSLQNRDAIDNHTKLIPAIDSSAAIQITKSDGVSAVLSVDTSERRIAINVLDDTHTSNVPPQTRLDVGGYLRLRQDQEYTHTSDRYTNSAALGPLVLSNRNVFGDGIVHNLGIHWNIVETWEPYSASIPTLTPKFKYADNYYNWDYAAFFGLSGTGDFIWQTSQSGAAGNDVNWNPPATRMALANNGSLCVGVEPSSATAKLDINGDSLRLRAAKTPAGATATGNSGEICWSSTHIYVCVSTNNWKRAALTSW